MLFRSRLTHTPLHTHTHTHTHAHPSTASSRNQMKLSRGCTKGGPLSMDGCFRVYVVNTTDALLLFFKQRNLEITSQ